MCGLCHINSNWEIDYSTSTLTPWGPGLDTPIPTEPSPVDSLFLWPHWPWESSALLPVAPEIFTVVIVSDLGTGGVKKMGSWWTQHLGQSIPCCLTMKNLLASWASSSCFEGYWLCNRSSLSLLPSLKSVQLRPKIPHWGPPVLAQVQITTELLVHLKMECYTMLQHPECIWAKHGWVFTGGLCK